MKKVLFATTALVATAGVATADISISGYAELGIIDADSVNATTGVKDATDTSNGQFFTDVDVTFSMSGTTDNGIDFGVSVDLDEAGGLGSTSGNNGTAIYLSGPTGKLTVGNTDGAMDFALTEVTGPGSINDAETGHEGFFGSYLDGEYDGQIARLDFNAGDLAVSVSTEVLDTDSAGRSSGYAIGAKYTTGGITIGVGHQTADSVNAAFGGAAAVSAVAGAYWDDSATDVVATTGAVAGNVTLATGDVILVAGTDAVTQAVAEVDATGLSVSGTFDALTVGVAYTSYDSSVAQYDADHVMVGFSYAMGDLTIGANVGSFDSDTNARDRDGYGVTANYALGGGATVQAGYESSERNGVDNGSSMSLGIAMAF